MRLYIDRHRSEIYSQIMERGDDCKEVYGIYMLAIAI